MQNNKSTIQFLTKMFSIIVFVILTTSLCYSQEISGSECEKYIPKSTKIKFNSKDNTIQYFKLRADAKVKSSDAISYLLTILKLNKEINLIIYSKETDKIGYTHTRYKFYFKSILIEDFNYIIHSKNELVVSGNGEYSKISNFNNSIPTIKVGDAINIGKSNLKSEHYYWKENEFPKPELTYILVNNSFRLSYKTDIYSVKPLARKYFYIDAENGKILKELNRIQHTDVIGTAHTKYNGVRPITTNHTGSNYILTETGRGNGINTYNLNNTVDYFSSTNFSDADNNWTSTINQDDAALDVHFGAEAFYDFYSSNFNRLSFDNVNGTINSYVHYDTSFVNAFWDGANISFGDGDGVNYTALTSLDVVGHELTHAVTQYSAGLQYQNESGALNESFSDIFGVAIDFYKNPSTANYLMGDQFNLTGTGFRDMSNPNSKNDPDTYLGNHWVTDPNFDNGGVHSNSGVQNYWFYLLVNGGSGTNDLNNNYSITGIGMSSAIEITYRSLTNYLTSTSQYSDARFFSIQAAIDLFGECSPEVIAVTNAWYVVGVGSQYNTSVIANFNSQSRLSCSNPGTINFYNLSSNASQFAWDFGDGNTSNLENPSHIYNSLGNFSVQLIATGIGFCSGIDTLLISNFITITNNAGPVNANCAPSSAPSSNSHGITNVQFNTFNNYSDYSNLESYQDFSCSYQTNVTAGVSYPLTFSTGEEFGYAWIDYNNNGDFEQSELVYSSNFRQYYHARNIIISGNTSYNIPIRMRIGSSINALTSSCNNPSLGQYEDYTVIILPNSNPPIANFESNTQSTTVNSPINFYDLSLNVPTTWEWYFEGASITNSTLQNPNVTYPNLGTFLVKLKVTNNFGQDSITKLSYINVVDTYTMCTNNSSTLYSGRLIDSGQENANYSDNEACTFLVNPPVSKPIRVNITSFISESNFDFLKIYDGQDENAPLIVSLTGTIYPTDFILNSGKVFFKWNSDGGVNSPGYDITWDTLISLHAGGITHSGIQTPGSIITFNSIEANYSNYSWDFGDGNSLVGNSQETHTYQNSGNYIVQLQYYDNNNYLKTYYDNLTIGSAGAINEITFNEFMLYPNPTSGIIHFDNNSVNTFNQLSITNTVGQEIYRLGLDFTSNKLELDLSHFENGIYYINLQKMNGEKITSKITKTSF